MTGVLLLPLLSIAIPTSRVLIHIIIRHAGTAAALTFGIITAGHGPVLVFVFGLRVFRDNVPGVEEAWDETEGAEGDVDEGVGGADSDFDPDCETLVLGRLKRGGRGV